MGDDMMNIQVIIMCKSPVQGQVKTRLMPYYTAEQATDLHCAMASTVIQRAKALFKHVCLAVDDVGHPFFKAFSLPTYAQGQGDLGERMQYIMRQIHDKQPILFLGTDSPHMQDKRLIQAAMRVQHDYDVVLGAVDDGGYDLIAMKSPYPMLFDGITWGSGQVLSQTQHQAQLHGLNCYTLERSFDVDTPDMLIKAIHEGWDIKRPYLHP
jgi:rSAM/selenodomain-associated transferase 1